MDEERKQKDQREWQAAIRKAGFTFSSDGEKVVIRHNVSENRVEFPGRLTKAGARALHDMLHPASIMMRMAADLEDSPGWLEQDCKEAK